MPPLRENHWAYDYLPKLDKLYDMLQVFELMHQGKMNGYICQGFNPLAAAPNKAKMNAALAQAEVPRRHGSAGDRDSSSGATTASTTTSTPRKIQTEVFRLPTTCFAEENGSLVNSARWLQWHWKGADPPGRGAQRTSRSWRASSPACARCTGRRAARFPIRS